MRGAGRSSVRSADERRPHSSRAASRCRSPRWPPARVCPTAPGPDGRLKAKVVLNHLASLARPPDGRLVLVMVISPMRRRGQDDPHRYGWGMPCAPGQRAAMRQPSMGPVFGMKGEGPPGAAGARSSCRYGHTTLHFTGDFAAIGQAHNLLLALIDNHIHYCNALGFDVRRIALETGGRHE